MPIRRMLMLSAAFTLGLSGASPSFAAEDAGAYLAARQASIMTDYGTAAGYFSRALISDPSNPSLMENVMTAQVGVGEVEAAVPVARRMMSTGTESQLANLVLMADALQRENYESVIEDLDAGMSVSPLVDVLVRSWAELGRGEVDGALASFDDAAATEGLQAFGLFHKALALASVGDYEGADAIFAGDSEVVLRMTRRGVVAHTQILSQLERNQEAVELIDSVFEGELDPQLAELRQKLEDGEVVPFSVAPTVNDGLAEVFFGVAAALSGETSEVFAITYSRIAEFLRPDHVDATLLTASLFERLEQYDMATAAYNRIPDDHPAFHAAELGRAEAMRQLGDVEGSIEVLRNLAESHSELSSVHMALGDALRQDERHEDATEAYTEAVAAFDGSQQEQWITYFARGITYERTEKWEQAEADFRKALELNPGQPQVLNYLGYSYLEMDENLDEAMAMIEQAVAARPNDGYITDSLGWGLYRLGRYQEAVEHMERATELMPVDPIVNDHLGDVYWAVGRELEAEFQWRRALSFEPEEKDAERIRRKLDVGLDKVLQEEGAKPLHAAQDG